MASSCSKSRWGCRLLVASSLLLATAYSLDIQQHSELASSPVFTLRPSTVASTVCGSNGDLVVSVPPGVPAISWSPGTLILGDASYGCVGKSGRPEPFCRRVLLNSVSLSQEEMSGFLDAATLKQAQAKGITSGFLAVTETLSLAVCLPQIVAAHRMLQASYPPPGYGGNYGGPVDSPPPIAPPSPPDFPLQPPSPPESPTQPPAPDAPVGVPPQAPDSPPMFPPGMAPPTDGEAEYASPPPYESYSYYGGDSGGPAPPNAFCIDPNDQCCTIYDEGACQVAGCNPLDFCVPKTNPCTNRTDQATCETDAFCAWGADSGGNVACSLIPTNHPCAPMNSTLCGASTVCTLRKTCAGSCASCDACQTILYAQVSSKLNSANVNKAQAVSLFNAACASLVALAPLSLASAQCDYVSGLISTSYNTWMALRPGAMCSALSACNVFDGCTDLHSGTKLTQAWATYSLTFNGQPATDKRCNSSCVYTSNATDASIFSAAKATNYSALCTLDGTATAALLGSDTITLNPGVTCFSDSDCAGNQLKTVCDYTTFTSSYVCDFSDGQDMAFPVGQCISPCQQPDVVELLALVREAIAPCEKDEDCTGAFAGMTCQSADGFTGCELPTCDDSAGFANFSSTPCTKICLPAARNPVSAKFDDSTLGITVTLNAQALLSAASVPCNLIFDTATSDKLGNAACSVDGKTLKIALGGDARIKPTDTLTLADTQTALFDFFNPTLYFTGSTTVATCGNTCAQPTAVLSGSGLLMLPCQGSTMLPVTYDALSSVDPAGRGFTNIVWSIASMPNNAAARTALTNMLNALNAVTVVSQKMSFSLTESDLRALPTGSYTLKVVLTSAFGLTATDTIQIAYEATGTRPMAAIVLPPNIVLSNGLSVDAAVVASTVCGNDTVQFTWRVNSLTLPVQRRAATLVSAAQLIGAGATVGSNVNVTLTVAFVRTPSVTYRTTQTVLVLGDPLVASLAGSPSGLVSNTGTLVFNASQSTDPSDPSNSVAPMRYSWTCTRADQPLASCFTDRGYTGNRNGSIWTVDASKLVAGVQASFVVTLTKGSGATLRTASATTTVTATSNPTFSVSLSLFCGYNLQTGRSNVCPSLATAVGPISVVATINTTTVANFGPSTNFTYAWSYPASYTNRTGLSLNNNTVIGATDAPIVVISPSGTPDAGGEILVQCSVTTNDGQTGVGYASITVVRPPSIGAGGGLSFATPTQTLSTTGTTVFTGVATGFSASIKGSDLQYSFGYKDVNALPTQCNEEKGMSPSPSYNFQPAGPGTYTACTCAFDVAGGYVCSFANITLNAPSASQLNALQTTLINANVNQALNSGSPANLAMLANNLAAGASLITPSVYSPPPPAYPPPAGRRFMSEFDSDSDFSWYSGIVRRQLQAQTNDAMQAQAVSLINALGSFSTTPDLKTCLFGMNILSNLAAAFPSLNTTQRQTLCSAGQACGQLGVSTDTAVSQAALATLVQLCSEFANAAAPTSFTSPAYPAVYPPPPATPAAGRRMALGWESEDDLSFATLPGMSRRRLVAVTQQALWVAGNLSVTASNTRSLLLKNANPGVTTTAAAPQMVVAVTTNTRAQIGSARLAFPASSAANAIQLSVAMPGAPFTTWCASNAACTGQTNIQVTAVYYANPAPWLAVASNFPFTNQPAIPASSFVVVSGVMDMQMGSYKSDVPICNATSPCSATIAIPINATLFNTSRTTACVRMQPTQGTTPPLTAVMDSSLQLVGLDPAATTAPATLSCTTRELGRVMIVQFDGQLAPAPPPRGRSPPPSPPAPPVNTTILPPMPPPPPPLGTFAARSGSAAISISATFNLDINAQTRDQFDSSTTPPFARNLYTLNPSLLTDPSQPDGICIGNCVTMTGYAAGSLVATWRVLLPDGTSADAISAFMAQVRAIDPKALFAGSPYANAATGVSVSDVNAGSGSSTNKVAIGVGVGVGVGGAMLIGVAATMFYIRRKKQEVAPAGASA